MWEDDEEEEDEEGEKLILIAIESSVVPQVPAEISHCQECLPFFFSVPN